MADPGFSFNFDVGADEDGEFETSTPGFTGRNCFIFMIDVSMGMFERGEDPDQLETYFERSLRAALHFYKVKCSTSSTDYIGLTFCGTQEGKNKLEDELLPHIYVYHPLELPSAERVVEIEDLLDGDVEHNIMEKFRGYDERYELRGALWNAVQEIDAVSSSGRGGPGGSKRIFLMTCNDDPHEDSDQERNNLLTQIADWRYRGIDLDVIPFGDGFDPAKIYQDVVNYEGREEEFQFNTNDSLDELNQLFRSKDHKRRTLANVKWQLADGLEISVNMYNLLSATRPPTALNRYRKTNEEILTNSTTSLAEDGRLLLPAEMKKFQTYGGQKIPMSTEEIEVVKHFEPAGMKLLGFKPVERLTERKPHYHVRPSLFLYPDNFWISGSGRMFAGLLDRCLERRKMAVCRLTVRKNVPPKIVYLVPQAEELDDSGQQTAPPGFHVVFMPFADDVRKTDLAQSTGDVTRVQLMAAKNLVSKMTFKAPFAIDYFPNPSLQKHYRAVEAMALEKSEIEPFDDVTEKLQKMVARAAGEELLAFRDALFPDGYTGVQSGGAKKRPAAGADGAAGGKKTRVDDAAPVDLKALVDSNGLGALTVKVLREHAQASGIALPKGHSLKKAEIIEIISGHYGK